MKHEVGCPFEEWEDENCFQRDAGVSCCEMIRRGKEEALRRLMHTVPKVYHDGDFIITYYTPDQVFDAIMGKKP